MPIRARSFSSVFSSVYEEDWAITRHLRQLPNFLPTLSRHEAFGYSLRLLLTTLAATEAYRRLGLQSGYWIPMTALLVQRPALAETFTRTAGSSFAIVGTSHAAS